MKRAGCLPARIGHHNPGEAVAVSQVVRCHLLTWVIELLGDLGCILGVESDRNSVTRAPDHVSRRRRSERR